MSKRREPNAGHAMAGAFVLLQLGIFALLSVMLVLFGVQAYRHTVARAGKINDDRILSSYIRSMVRAQDEEGGVEVENGDTVCISYLYEGTRYVTRIYVYDGKLREWFSDEDHPFRPEEGEVICEAESLSAEVTDHLLRVDVTDAYGDTVPSRIALHSQPVEAIV